MITIAFIMGPTCTGKTSFLEYAARKDHQVGLVEVGKALRQKYPPSYFVGQAAPEHTRQESWELCENGIRQHIADRKRLILVDGQPRSVDQVEKCFTALRDLGRLSGYWKRFVYFHTTRDVREQRMGVRFGSIEDEKLRAESIELATRRQVNDELTYFHVFRELSSRRVPVDVVETTNEPKEHFFDRVLMTLIDGRDFPFFDDSTGYWT